MYYCTDNEGYTWEIRHLQAGWIWQEVKDGKVIKKSDKAYSSHELAEANARLNGMTCQPHS